MNGSNLNCIVPAPVSVEPAEGKFFLKDLRGIRAETGLERFCGEAREMLAYFGIAAGETADGLSFALDPALGKESWRLTVGKDGIRIRGGDEAGVFYALQALTQIVAAASIRGPAAASVGYGTVADSPRFGWRGFMLDPARHFQSVKTV